MSIKKITKRHSSEILDDLKKVAGLEKDYQLAELLGVKQNSVSTWRTRNTIPYEEIIAFCNKHALDIYGLLTGAGAHKVHAGEEKNKVSIPISDKQESLSFKGTGMLTIGDIVQNVLENGTDDQKTRLRRAKVAFTKIALDVSEEIDDLRERQKKVL